MMTSSAAACMMAISAAAMMAGLTGTGAVIAPSLTALPVLVVVADPVVIFIYIISALVIKIADTIFVVILITAQNPIFGIKPIGHLFSLAVS